MKERKPWGSFEVIELGDKYKVKNLTVNPKSKLSLQSHKYRTEYWTCVRGSGKIIIDEDIFQIKSGASFVVLPNQKHRLINIGISDLVVIEVQLGSYLEEDDIIRYEDDYNRIKK